MGKPARFHEADLKRAVNVARKANIRDYRVNIMPDGTISLIVGTTARIPSASNSCDDLLDG